MSAPPRFPQGPFIDTTSGHVTLEAQQWLQNPEFVTATIDNPLPVASGGTGSTTAVQSVLQMAGPFYAAQPTGQITGSAQVNVALWSANGAPDNAAGQNGDLYLRGDGGVLTTIYQKRAGLWVGIV